MTKKSDRSAIKGMIQKAKSGQGDAAKKPAKAEDPIVTFTMNVPKSWRKHWAIQSRIKEVTMTKVATDALIEAFGLPPES